MSAAAAKKQSGVVQVADDVHRALKIRAAKTGRSGKDVADAILREALSAEIAELTDRQTALPLE